MDGQFMGGRFCNLHNIQNQPTNSSSTGHGSFYSYDKCCMLGKIFYYTLLLQQHIALCIVVMIH